MSTKKSEQPLQYNLFQKLCSTFLPSFLLPEDEKSIEFNINERRWKCTLEGDLYYSLPNGGSLSHKSDVLFSLPTKHYISLELKYLSAVTDQFKTRSYDMLHLKQTYKDKLIGIMVYVHKLGVGISINQARTICYPFDYFVGLNHIDLEKVDFWDQVINVIQQSMSDSKLLGHL